MSAVINVQTALRPISCYQCGTVFGVESGFYSDRLNDKGRFFCPNGHGQHFVGKTEAERLQEQLAKERSRVAFYKRESESQKRSRAAIKGQLTKTRNRIANGVCPCCNRSFADLQRHMSTKHPDYAVGE